MKTLPALLALLLAVAPVASGAILHAGDGGPTAGRDSAGLGALGSSPPADSHSPDNRPINALSLPPGSLAASAVETQYVDFGSGLEFDRDLTQSRLRTLTAVERIRAANSSDQRQRRILGELNDIEQRVITLRTAQKRAISAYASESMTPRRFLLRLASIDAQARELDHRRTRVQRLAKETEDLGLDSRRFDSLERELDTFTGPVRHRVGNVVTGRNETTRVYVATATNAVVLSTIVDDRYVREAYRSDLRNVDARGSLSPEAALNVTSTQYPLVWERADSTSVVGAGNVYRVTIPYQYGTLTTLIDVGTNQVFMESQTRSLSSFPNSDTVTRSRDQLRMTVNRSYPGGPVRISLVDAETGDPVNANVTVGPASGGNSDFVGYTGSDGVLWTLSPATEYTVFAIKGNAVVAINAKPIVSPRIYSSNNSSVGNGTATPVSAVDDGASPTPF